MRRLTRGFASVGFAQFGAPSTVLKSSAAVASTSPSSGEVAVKITACHVTGEDIRAVRNSASICYFCCFISFFAMFGSSSLVVLIH